MKILFVNNARLCSGAEEHLIDLAKWLLDKQNKIVFAVRNNSVFADRLLAEKVGFTACFSEKGEKIASVVRLVRLIISEQPDVISVNREHNIYPAWLAMWLALPFLRQRPKIVMVFHTPTGRSYPVLRMFDGIIATSRYTASSFLNANPSLQGRVEVIHYGIAVPPVPTPEKANPARKRKFFSQRSFPLIGMVGELWKNQEELVPIAQRLVKKFPDITIAIVGGEGHESFNGIRNRVKAVGLEDHFDLVPRIPRERIPDVFYDFDLSVSTHRNEGFGIVHIESLAAGTPVVAYRAGGLVEILEKGGSLLIDGGVEDFADGVSNLLADENSRARLAADGVTIVEAEFSIAAMGNKHLDYYQSVVNGSDR